MADVYKQSFKQNYTNNIELSIFNCGLERCAPGQTWGPGIRDHYLIHLVVSGKGTFEVGGKTFEVVRWSGYNHIDAAPRTAEDTATMKSIYGGEWSWNRRAILILYNGHVYAASMNGMPHGTTTISSNDFDGHFCIHFKNSKTHESDKVDPDHQAAVTTASKATW